MRKLVDKDIVPSNPDSTVHASLPTVSVSGRTVSLSALSDKGQKTTNKDAALVTVNDDGSWVMAVADGSASSAAHRHTARKVLEAIPGHIGSVEEMTATFVRAAQALQFICGCPFRRAREDTRDQPLLALAVSAWSSQGGLITAWMGDCIAFFVQDCEISPITRMVGKPHINVGEGLTSGLHPAIDIREIKQEGSSAFGITQMSSPVYKTDTSHAIVLLTDGAWVPLLEGRHKQPSLYDLTRPDFMQNAFVDGSRGGIINDAADVTLELVDIMHETGDDREFLVDNASMAVALIKPPTNN